ncbi:MAG: hypothetical protein IPI60_14015 [Saprospiraceae bacterium]|jgi:hypothetical protein|nr:hypothetical protein [Saprospiraceae bacterium]
MRNFLILVIVLMVVAALSNPSHSTHREKIKATFKQDNPLISAVGGGEVFTRLVDYHSYILFSTTTLDDEKVSTGIFGMVWVNRVNIEE